MALCITDILIQWDDLTGEANMREQWHRGRKLPPVFPRPSSFMNVKTEKKVFGERGEHIV